MPRVTSKGVRSVAKELSDQLRNIRRRYERAASRYERDAAKADGREARELLKAASNLREQSQQYFVKNITNAKRGSAEYNQDIRKAIARGREPSLDQLASAAQTAAENRQRLIDNILSGSSGDAFYAATVQLWRGTDYHKRQETIVEKFNEKMPKDQRAADVLDVINYLQEQSGIDYLSPSLSEESGDDDRYRIRARAGAAVIQNKVLS